MILSIQAILIFETQLCLKTVAISSETAVVEYGQRTQVYAIGPHRINLIEPVTARSRSGRFLQKHPAGVMTIGIAVNDAEVTFKEVTHRQATPVTGLMVRKKSRSFAIASPLGDVEFSFIERTGDNLSDDCVLLNNSQQHTPIHWTGIDHITANSRTAWPVAEWYRQIFGLEDLFFGEYHTTESGNKDDGSGFKWMILCDPPSNLRLATNEPLFPCFNSSQTEQFVFDNGGPGVQHLALGVPRIIEAVRQIKLNGINFLSTPDGYYNPDRFKARAKASGWEFNSIIEDLDRLKQHHVLIDGSSDGFLLQIFNKRFDKYKENKMVHRFSLK